MVWKFLFVVIISFCFKVNAYTITNDTDSYSSINFSMYEDKNASLQVDDLFTYKHLFKEQIKQNIGIKKYPVWNYNSIQNKSSSLKHMIFSNPRAGTDFIDVYIFKNKKLLHHHTLGDMNPQSKRELLYRKSIFELELEPYHRYEIFAKFSSYGAIDINWEIHEQKDYLNAISQETLLFGFIGGFVFLMSIFILFIDRIFPSLTHKIYFLIIVITSLTQFSISGILYQHGLTPYLNTITSWSLGTFAAALIGFFPIYFFDLKKIMPRSTALLLVLNYSLMAFALVFLFYPLYPNLLYLAVYSNFILFIVSFLLIYISFRLYLKNLDGSLLYLLGNTSFTFTLIYFLIGLLGFTNVNNTFYFSLGVGTGLNIFFMAMAIGKKIFQIKKEKENALVIMNEYSKLSVLGQSMINMSHQWKEPINHIYYAINNIYAAQEFKDPNLAKIIDASLSEIKQTTIYMASTGKNFLSYYKEEIKLETLSLKQVIKFSKNILNREFEKGDIHLSVENSGGCLINSDKNLLCNIFIILFENSIKAFRSKKILNPSITIRLYEDKSNVYINFLDNAGGIKVEPIASIFEQDLSDSNSTGIGLFLAKNILQLKLNGDISVENKKKGVRFHIILAKS